jgi:WD40 repeat protein
VLSTAAGGEICIFSALDGTHHYSLGAHNGDVFKAIFSTDGNVIASGDEGNDSSVVLWDATLLWDAEVQQHQLAMYPGIVGLCSRDISSSSGPNVLHVLNTIYCTSFVFSPDNAQILSGSLEGPSFVFVLPSILALYRLSLSLHSLSSFI